MKKIISLLLIIIVMVLNSYSQPVENNDLLKNEISVSYAFGPAQEISDVFNDMIYSISTLTSGETKTYGFGGPISFEYKRIIDGYYGIGILGLFTSYNTELIKKSNNSLIYSTTNKYYAILTKFDFYYGISEWVQMYSGVGLGIIKSNNSIKFVNNPITHYSDATEPAFQLNIFSLRVGKKLGGYFELGYGTNGILNLGVSYKF